MQPSVHRSLGAGRCAGGESARLQHPLRLSRQHAERPVRIPFSEKDRYGAFAHRKSRRQIERQTTIGMLATRAAQRVSRPFLILLVVVCLVDFAAPFAGTFIFRLVDRSVSDQSGSRGDVRHNTIPICSRWDYVSGGQTCLVDGDTGWERGVKWRLSDVDAPEISKPSCARELQLGLAARDRMQHLMSAEYTIVWLERTDR